MTTLELKVDPGDTVGSASLKDRELLIANFEWPLHLIPAAPRLNGDGGEKNVRQVNLAIIYKGKPV